MKQLLELAMRHFSVLSFISVTNREEFPLFLMASKNSLQRRTGQ